MICLGFLGVFTHSLVGLIVRCRCSAVFGRFCFFKCWLSILEWFSGMYDIFVVISVFFECLFVGSY